MVGASKLRMNRAGEPESIILLFLGRLTCSPSTLAACWHGHYDGWRITQETTIELPSSISAIITLMVYLMPPRRGHTTLTLTPTQINLKGMVTITNAHHHALHLTIVRIQPAIPLVAPIFHHPLCAPHRHHQTITRNHHL